MLVDPDALPFPPVSWTPFQLFIACRLLTLIAFEGTVTLPSVLVTVTETLVTQTDPPSPDAITLIVCEPALVPTVVSTDVPLVVVVSGLLSSEYPIDVTVSDEHVLAVADSVNGD